LEGKKRLSIRRGTGNRTISTAWGGKRAKKRGRSNEFPGADWFKATEKLAQTKQGGVSYNGGIKKTPERKNSGNHSLGFRPDNYTEEGTKRWVCGSLSVEKVKKKMARGAAHGGRDSSDAKVFN